MKRILAFVLTVLFISAGIPVFADGELPSVGDEISGFRVVSVIPMDILGATGVLFEHEKSGAKLLYLDSEDTNRSFDITFQTPALDDKGKPHVFEHITISGSRKYPDANLFFSFTNQTYSTFVNAVTYSGMTSFPVSSLSQDQLITMMDYYLSGVFTPLLYDEPRLVEREAWRYELTDGDAPLNIAGTVYSEMQGARTIQVKAAENNLKTLFKDGLVSHVSGGIPEYTKTLTYDELIDFHDSYYHPSNCLITLYGNLDYERFLSFIDDEYLSKYDKKDIYVEKGKVEKYQETLYETYDAAVEEGAPVENASYIYYSFAADEAEFSDVFKASILASCLNSESSPLMIAAHEKFPGANIYVNVDMDMPSLALSFIASGVNEDDRDEFVAMVDGVIGKVSSEGITQQELDSELSMEKLALLLTPEQSNLGVNASITIALGWTYFNRVDYFNVFDDVINSITVSDIVDVANRFLADNTHRAVSVTRPVAGLAEKNAQALQDELDKMKSAMSDEEIAALVKKSNDFIKWGSAGIDQELINKIANMTVEALPEEIKHYDVTDETIDGVRYVTSRADVKDVATTSIMLDGSTIPVNKLQDVQVYLSLLGSLDTEKHSKEELSTLITRYLPGFSASLNAQLGYNGVDSFYAAILTWKGLGEDAQKATELLKEIAFDTKLDNTKGIVDILTRTNKSTRDSFDSMALNLQMIRSMAKIKQEHAFSAYTSGIDMYRHIENMISDPGSITKRLESARDLIYNRRGAIVSSAGSESALEEIKKGTADFFDGMPDEEREKVDYSVLVPDADDEAVINNSSVHMNMIAGQDYSFNGKYIAIDGLINDMYMMPKLRNALGAYGAYIAFSDAASMMYTYRDPNLAGTFDIFEQLPEYLRTVDITQEDVNSYIIGSYGNLNYPVGELTGAMGAVKDAIIGMDNETRIEWMKQAKATTVEDVRAMADVIEKLLENGIRSTSGTLTSIGDDIKLFDTSVRLEKMDNGENNAA